MPLAWGGKAKSLPSSPISLTNLNEEKMIRYLFVITTLLFFLTGCSHQVNVTTPKGEPGALTGLKSYNWLDRDHSKASPTIKNPEVGDLIVAAVDSALSAKGYTRAESGSMDFVVAWAGGVEQKIKQDSVSHFFRSYGYGAVASGMVESKADLGTYEYEKGTIILDFFDTKSKAIILHRTASARLVQEMNEEQARLYIKKLVDSMLQDLPAVSQ